MGEAKRRKQTDPDYGKKSKPAPKQSKQKAGLLGLKNVSKTEWIVWAVLLGALAAIFAATSAI